jgi:transposase
LLAGAFRPDDQVCVLRAYLRQRHRLITHASQHIQHMQKALEQMNVKLPEVVSDVTGVTGMAIIKAILAGERDPVTLAKLRDRRCKHGEEQIAKALQGTWRVEHLFALRQAVELYEFSHRQLATCDEQIAAHVATFPDKSAGQPLPPKPRTCKRKANAPRFDARSPLYRMAGVDLTGH